MLCGPLGVGVKAGLKRAWWNSPDGGLSVIGGAPQAGVLGSLGMPGC